MWLQGLAAAALIGGAAVVYAQVQDNGYLSVPRTQGIDDPGAKEDPGKHAGRKAEHEQDRATGGQRADDDD